MGEGVHRLSVEHVSGDQFRIEVRDHWLLVDQPESDGGEDLGPTPTELFVAGLAACVGFFARRYFRRHQLSSKGLRVETEFEFSEDRPSRVSSIEMRVILPPGFPEARLPALRAVVQHCTVHNSIENKPDIRIGLVEGVAAA